MWPVVKRLSERTPLTYAAEPGDVLDMLLMQFTEST
jgi:hypothetical protein